MTHRAGIGKKVAGRPVITGKFVGLSSVGRRPQSAKTIARATGTRRPVTPPKTPVSVGGKALDTEALRALRTTLARMQRIPALTEQLVRMGEPERAAARALEEVLRNTEVIISAGAGQSVKLFGALLATIRKITDLAGRGTPAALLVSLGDEDAAEFDIETAVPVELTSQEVADLLNVSRPFVVKLARAGELPHWKVGNRHRFALDDVLAYQQQQHHVREQALAAIVQEGGYTADDF
jgi:excisionase family DNA binding protein